MQRITTHGSAYVGHGLSVIPTRETKARLAHWQPYQERRATPAEVALVHARLCGCAVGCCGAGERQSRSPGLRRA